MNEGCRASNSEDVEDVGTDNIGNRDVVSPASHSHNGCHKLRGAGPGRNDCETDDGVRYSKVASNTNGDNNITLMVNDSTGVVQSCH